MIKIKEKIKLIVLTLLISCTLQASKVDLTLREFANMVSIQNRINILISSSIDEDDKKNLFYLGNKNARIFLPAFEKMLNLKDLILVREKDYYYIDKLKAKEDKLIFHSVSMNNLVYNDVKELLKLYGIDSIYIKTTNSVGFFSTAKQYNYLKVYIKSLDKKLPQIQFKINIFTTNLDDLKERGFNLSAYAQSVQKVSNDGTSDTGVTPNVNFTYFLNLITMPYNAPSNIVSNSAKGFYGVVKYLNQNGYTKIENSPVLTAKSHSKVSFSTVKNIPYKTSSTQVSGGTDSKTTESIEYKDVGLKIDISPVVINDVINFDLNLVIEELTSTSTLTPTTEKRVLNSSYSLKRGEILVLSGVNKTTSLSSEFGVPFLKEIWLLGELFKYKTNTKTKSVLTITVEVL